MLDVIAVIPSAPVLVPELATGAAAEVSGLTAAVIEAARELPDRWIAVGVAPEDRTVEPHASGTFGGFGADVRICLAPRVATSPEPLPLCALITGWVRGRANPNATAQVRAMANRLGIDEAVRRGRALRAELDAARESVGVLLLADGANTLSASAPGGHDPESPVAQRALDDALASGDVAALAGLTDAAVGRVAYQVLAGLAAPAPAATRELFRAAPYGVGYFVGVWRL